ncbi:MAG: hypothetical protein ACR2NN_04050 [Bryobacteraceae bacterium]
MKRFQFGPERVRLWRGRQAEVEELKLQQFHSEMQRLILQRQAIETEARTAEETVCGDTYILAQDLVNLDSFKQFVRARSLQLEAEKKQWDSRIAQQQKVAATARRAAELLDRLKIRSLAEWRANYNREQENLSNDLFLAKRRKKGVANPTPLSGAGAFASLSGSIRPICAPACRSGAA